MEFKHLDAHGKGETDYDYANDILFFKIKGREYKKTIDFDDIVLDLDNEGFITGIQVFEASKIFGMPKDALLNVRGWEFHTKVEDKIITVRLMFKVVQRNKVIMKSGQNLIRESSAPLINSEAMCTIEA